MRTHFSIWTLAAVLLATGRAGLSAAEEASVATGPPAKVVEVDDLALPDSLGAKFDLADVPQAIRTLDGERVRIHGYIGLLPKDEPVPAVRVYGATQGRVYHQGYSGKPVHLMIGARLRTPQAFTFDECVVVEGVFRVRPLVRDSKVRILYFVEDAVATPSKPRTGYHNSVGWGC
jgi:hypothetical protein